MIMIPMVAGAAGNEELYISKLGWTTVQGFIYGAHEINSGTLIEFNCIFVHYVSQGLGHRVTGFRAFGTIMVIPTPFKGILLPHFILGWSPSSLEF